MAATSEIDALALRSKTCPSCLREGALGAMKRALLTESLDGRRASLLATAAIELEKAPGLDDARAALALFQARRLVSPVELGARAGRCRHAPPAAPELARGEASPAPAQPARQ